jgi:Flp pilus assembly protein TadD
MSAAGAAIADAEASYRAGDYEAAALLMPFAHLAQPNAAALRLLSMCRLRLDAREEALALLEQAVGLAPDDPWAQLHYGIGLQSAGRHAEAVPLFRALLTLLPDDPAPPLNLATSLLAMGDVQGAIHPARRVQLRASAMPQSHYMLGLAYLTAGFHERASACFRPATTLAPHFAEAWANLGVAQYRGGQIEAAKQAMRAALDADPENSAAAADLGGFLRLTGETEVAETLLREQVARNPNATAASLNLVAELLQEDRAAEALTLLDRHPPSDRGMQQHWLLQRTLAFIKLGRRDEILAAHSDVHGAGERPALAQTFARLAGGGAGAVHRIASLDTPVLDHEAERNLRELREIAPQAKRIIDKMPGNYRNLGLAALLLPSAKVIACERDPRDIGLSIFTFQFYGQYAYAHDLADLGWTIAQQRCLMAHWRTALPNPTLTLRLTDWVEDFLGTLRRVLDFLGLTYDSAYETFYRTDRRVRTVSRAQVRKPVNARGIGRWHGYERQLAPLIAALREHGALQDEADTTRWEA